MRKHIIALCLVMIMLIPVIVSAQKSSSSDAILGVWFNAEKDAKIEIVKEDGKYFGTVIWLKNPLNAQGKPKTDTENPDAKLRKRPRLGLTVLTGLEYKSGNKYYNGKVYDPKSGKTYSAQAQLANHNLLKLRGFIGISLIGRTSEWTRTTPPEPEPKP